MVSMVHELGYSVDESGQYELVIVFTEQLQEGAYSITTKDIVTDLSKNRLDGNYDGVAGGSFTVRFNVGVSGVPPHTTMTTTTRPTKRRSQTRRSTISIRKSSLRRRSHHCDRNEQ